MSIFKSFATKSSSKRAHRDELAAAHQKGRVPRYYSDRNMSNTERGVAKSSKQVTRTTGAQTPDKRRRSSAKDIHRQPFSYTLSVDDSLRALALTLCKSQRTGLKRETAVFDLACDIRAVDRLLLLSGWQTRSFLCTENVCFVHMVMCHARYLVCSQLPETRDAEKRKKDKEKKFDLPTDQLRQLLQIVLYVSYCYVGSETGYPSWPFRPYHWEQTDFNEMAFWLAAALSRPMLDYNRSSAWQKVYHDDLARVLREDVEEKSQTNLDLEELRWTSVDTRRREWDSFSETNDSGAFSDSDSADSVLL